MDYLNQLLGLFGFIVGVIAFSFQDNDKMKKLMTFSSLILSIHFYYLEFYSLAILKLLNTFRNLLSIKYSSTYIVLLFLILYWASGFYFCNNLIEWLPIVTISLSTIAIFKLKEISLKIAFLPANIVWIIMALYSSSIGAFLLEFFILIVNVKTIYTIKNKTK